MTEDIKLYNAWAFIDTGHLRHNIHEVIRYVGGPERLIVIVKADAYGHGIQRVSSICHEEGIRWFGVANVREGLQVREVLEEARILILSSGMTGHAHEIVRNRLTPVVSSYDMAVSLGRAAAALGMTQQIHITVDTGMGRIGVWYEGAVEFIEQIASVENLEIEGVCTHYASSSSPDRAMADKQAEAFRKTMKALEARGIHIPLRHIANSGAVLNRTDSLYDLARVGILMYGVSPLPSEYCPLSLKQVMTLRSKVAYIKTVEPGRPIGYMSTFVADRKTRIATVPIGYGDGYSRHISNKGQVLIRGRRCPVVGTVTMDQIMVDVGHLDDCHVEDDVVLFGYQGDVLLPVTEVSRWGGTIAYDSMCSIKGRVCRVYV